MKPIDWKQAAAYATVSLVAVALWLATHRWGVPAEYTTPALAVLLTLLQGAMRSYFAPPPPRDPIPVYVDPEVK